MFRLKRNVCPHDQEVILEGFEAAMSSKKLAPNRVTKKKKQIEEMK